MTEMAGSARRGLQIYNARERRLVGAADALLSPLRWFRRSSNTTAIRRVLLLRLERIGDLLMVLDAIQDARVGWPDAEIDLAVGAWNDAIARLIPGIRRVEVASAPWLSRETSGNSWSALIAAARNWRNNRYDLVLNFEPDIRSNALAWLTGAPRRAGYSSGGGAPFLTDAAAYDPTAHVSANARRLVARALRRNASADEVTSARRHPVPVLMALPADSVAKAEALVAGARLPLIGLHVSGGRLSKQWHLDRFGIVARTLADRHQATIVLTGDSTDRQLVDDVRQRLPGVPTIDACGTLGIVDLAALLARLDVLVTGDTGPMHLAAVVGTPVVALFGPSNPARYGPLGPRHRVLRVDLPCSPCGQVRLPPERCRGHVPDCMDGIQVDMVVAVADEVLAENGRRGPIADC
jgi:ADP-heptose:LPS heptosyltransferase